MKEKTLIRKQFTVTGMDCADCALHVENAVKKINGVTDVKINLLNSELQVSIPTEDFDSTWIIQAIQNAGYGILESGLLTSSFFLDPDDLKQSEPVINDLSQIEKVKDVLIRPESGELRITHTMRPEELIQFFALHKIKVKEKSTDSVENRWLVMTTIISGILTIIGSIIFYTVDQAELYIPFFAAAIGIGGIPIARKGIREALGVRLGMNFLMSSAIIGAVLIGEWHEAAMVVFLFVLSQYLETRTMERARRSINSLMNQRPRTAAIKNDESFISLPVEAVRAGNVIGVKAGEQIPVDGHVISGKASLDQSSITGESLPVDVQRGSKVFAGTISLNGFLEIRADNAYHDSTFAKILDLVAKAQAQKSRHQTFVERFSLYYTPIVLSSAVLLAVLLPLLQILSWSEAIYRALVVLIISCPCAFVISTPVTVISGLTNAMRAGILVKGGRFLEQFARLRAIAFDKTGTLTHGNLVIENIIPLNGFSSDQLIQLAASLASKSNHPVSRAITVYARQYHLQLQAVDEFNNLDGRGIVGKINHIEYFLGNHRLFEERGMCDQKIHHQLSKIEDSTRTAVILGNASKICGIISISDQIKTKARTTIKRLAALGFDKIHMITGDNKYAARAIAEKTGIESFDAELLPGDKVSTIQNLKKDYGDVAMVGDGINDAPALAASSIGVAMGVRGSDAALETADVALMGDNLLKLVHLRELSVSTLRVIKQNIAIALSLKFVFLMLAIPGLATLWMAVFADMGASMIVIFNGLRVLVFKPQRSC